MADSPQKYGSAIPDQVERISTFFDAHLNLMSDVRDLYKERVAIEREYAAKLHELTKTYADKKTRLEASFVVGKEPAKACDEHNLKQSTLNAMYDRLLDSMTATADDHNSVADALSTQVIDSLKAVAKKNEDVKKKEMDFYNKKLLADRNKVYSDRIKAKDKYDEECGEVDVQRTKQGRADDKHAERIARQAEQQRNDMLNCKNAYIISIAVSNGIKDKFYTQDLPELENNLQILQTKLVKKFTGILSHAQSLQHGHQDALKRHIAGVESALSAISPEKDQNMFIEYNTRPFTLPADWKFEPCPTFYDTDQLNVDPAPKVFLQNKVAKSRMKLQELAPVLDSKRREVEQFAKLAQAYEAEHSHGSTDDISDNFMDARHTLVGLASSETILEAEIEVIEEAIGDDFGAQRPHTFKSSSFSIPTTCGYCKTSIWGLSKQGKTCKACNLSVHAKCELKVPADCAHGSLAPTASALSRTSTSASRKSTLGHSYTPSVLQSPATPSASSFVGSAVEEEESYPTATLVFDFTASSEFELSINDGAVVSVLEPDDGSGWVKVRNAQGRDGLVPASYLVYGEPDRAATPTAKSFASQGSGEYVKAIYAYAARGADELGLTEGEVIELSAGPNGGRFYGDGWWEGHNKSGQKGIFPSNYVQDN
ncbi:hypothetical protein CYLTODRAFT_421746 [Cylindrobasidium torrendii FP15055 ss-10]|uniref:FCH-domain-containing protein n=1 Tax=Cylindrobasidium torrendii FP15055 ss-10 TaxID=1314674 RepID=A0A0D7BCT8_9AGAR|nr:hypothetical protein CYLTODRAFT_421746 [Cylindrobasidium torrendii FP15055 ss-10]